MTTSIQNGSEVGSAFGCKTDTCDHAQHASGPGWTCPEEGCGGSLPALAPHPAGEGEGTEWFWRIVDANGLSNVSSDEQTALGELCRKAEAYDALRPAGEGGLRDRLRRLEAVYAAARGMCFGYDWNQGSAAWRAGYRPALIEAVHAVEPLPDVPARLARPSPTVPAAPADESGLSIRVERGKQGLWYVTSEASGGDIREHRALLSADADLAIALTQVPQALAELGIVKLSVRLAGEGGRREALKPFAALADEIERMAAETGYPVEGWAKSCARDDLVRARDAYRSGALRAASAEVDGAGGDEDDLTWLRRQVISLCEDTEDRASHALERPNLTDHEKGFHKGAQTEAKGIRRAIAEVVRCRLQDRAALVPAPVIEAGTGEKAGEDEPHFNTPRPTGNNADEWNLWLQEHEGYGAPYIAVQIAEALDAATLRCAPPVADAYDRGHANGLKEAKLSADYALQSRAKIADDNATGWKLRCEFLEKELAALRTLPSGEAKTVWPGLGQSAAADLIVGLISDNVQVRDGRVANYEHLADVILASLKSYAAATPNNRLGRGPGYPDLSQTSGGAA